MPLSFGHADTLEIFFIGAGRAVAWALAVVCGRSSGADLSLIHGSKPAQEGTRTRGPATSEGPLSSNSVRMELPAG